jgi:hypothetical protein
MDHAGRHGSRRAPARAVPGERHQQQQAGAIGHAGRHRPWAMGHAGAPAPAPAAGRRHRAAPGGRHQQQQASRPGAIGHGPCWGTGTSTSSRPAPWITLARQTGSPGRSKPGARGRQGESFSRPIPAPPVGDSKHCPREKAGGKGQETRQKRLCMYEEISLFNKFSICPRYVPALSPLCPR